MNFSKKLKTYIAKHFINEKVILYVDFHCQLGNNTDKSVSSLKDLIRYYNLDFFSFNGLCYKFRILRAYFASITEIRETQYAGKPNPENRIFAQFH